MNTMSGTKCSYDDQNLAFGELSESIGLLEGSLVIAELT
jgi:hypothetical protein